MKYYILIILFLLLNFISFSDSLNIGVAEPYAFNKSNGTVFIKNNLIFELFTLFKNDNYKLFPIYEETLNISDFYSKNIEYSIENNFDYLLFIETYSAKDYIFLTINFFNPYTKEKILMKIYNIKFDIQINKNLEDISEQIFTSIENLNLQKNPKKNILQTNNESKEEKKTNDFFDDFAVLLNNYPKNEVFVMNGFLKNNSEIYSNLSIYTGYSRYISNAFFLDVGFFGGLGIKTDSYINSSFSLDDKYAGVFAGLHFYVKGLIEPNFGARVELSYNTLNNLSLSIPIDFGFKIFTSKHNIIRINTSFPLNTYDILNNIWNKKITLGFMVGYGFKI